MVFIVDRTVRVAYREEGWPHSRRYRVNAKWEYTVIPDSEWKEADPINKYNCTIKQSFVDAVNAHMGVETVAEPKVAAPKRKKKEPKDFRLDETSTGKDPEINLEPEAKDSE